MLLSYKWSVFGMFIVQSGWLYFHNYQPSIIKEINVWPIFFTDTFSPVILFGNYYSFCITWSFLASVTWSEHLLCLGAWNKKSWLRGQFQLAFIEDNAMTDETDFDPTKVFYYVLLVTSLSLREIHVTKFWVISLFIPFHHLRL